MGSGCHVEWQRIDETHALAASWQQGRYSPFRSADYANFMKTLQIKWISVQAVRAGFLAAQPLKSAALLRPSL